MNPQVPDELLSAYFDGEASPEERAVVEQMLDESVASRRALDEIAQLSGLLHSFPREVAPAKLAARVQQQTAHLPLAEQIAAAPSSAASGSPVRSLHREWLAAGLGALVTVASLFLMMNLVDRSGSFSVASRDDGASSKLALHTPATRYQSSRESAGVTADVMAVNGDHDRFDDGERRLLRESRSLSATGVVPRDSSSEQKLAEGLATSPRRSKTMNEQQHPDQQSNFEVAAKSKASAATNNLSVMADNPTLPLNLSNGDFLNGLRVGEVYQFVPQAADPESNVAVVDLAVIDIERGADQVQVLLSRNNIRQRPAGQASQSGASRNLQLHLRNKRGEPSKPSNSNDFVVVYSVAPGEQLAKALEDMSQQPELFLAWSTQPPVQLPISENLAEQQTGNGNSKDATAAAKESSAAQQLAPSDKALTADDGLDEDAALALNALLARGADANNGYAYPVDGTAKNAGAGSPANAPKADAKSSEPAADQPASPLLSDAVKKSVGQDNGRRAIPAPAAAGLANQNADLKRSGAGLDGPRSDRAYQQRFNVQTDLPMPVEPLLSNAASQGVNPRGAVNPYRAGTNNFLSQQSAGYVRQEGTRHAVKVLFVLHSPPVPAAAAPMPAGKPNR